MQNLFLAVLLLPLTGIHYLINLIWNACWDCLSKIRLPSKVISVGNIMVGGTGKTTLTIYLAEYFRSKGKSVAIVAKGYGRKNKKPNIIGSSGNFDWQDCGDEPAMMARLLPGIKIYVDNAKYRAAQRAAEDGHEIIIVDDGFQHRKLYRDLDIVCLDFRKPFGNGLLLPSGRLREPKSALKRADVAVFFGDPGVTINCDTHSKPQFLARKMAAGLKSLDGQPSDLKNGKALAFCGIGNPDSFRSSLKNLGLEVLEFILFNDHHVYSQSDIIKLQQKYRNLKADFLVTTLKDMVKLEKIWPSNIPLYYLDIRLQFDNEADFLKLVDV